jgi:adenosylcobinamide kinase / adenosylcobinamide-phosphate guanylyltransferase
MDNSITRFPFPETASTSQQLILVTGAARCGKSEWAETLAIESCKAVTYIATATIDPTDREWQARILRHQQRRPTTWHSVSEIENLAFTISQFQISDCLLIDSLGTWVANSLEQSDSKWEKLATELLGELTTNLATIILVSEETGWGVVPAYPSGRLFRDRLGMLSRQIGSIASTVYLVTGGHVLNLSELGQKLGVERCSPK